MALRLWRQFLPAASCLALLIVLLPSGPALAEGRSGKRYAVLVGVNEYEHKAWLSPLKYTENDVEGLARLLTSKAGGFHHVRVLTATRGRTRAADRPTAANVRAALRDVLRKCAKDDVVLVAFSCHGVQIPSKVGAREEACFCVADSSPDNTKSRVAVREVFEAFEGSRAGAKLLLVDACRNNPGKGGRGIDVDAVPRPPQGIAALFSCSSGESAWESGKLKHSVFFHFVLEGMRGQAKDRKGVVSWHHLVGYVTDQVSDELPRVIARPVKQTPHQVANLRGKSPVLIHNGLPLLVEGGKSLKWELALELKARGVGEASFSKTTKQFGLEAFTDGRTGHVVYVSQTGSVAAVPGKWFTGRSSPGAGPIGQHGVEVSVRPFGEGGDVRKGSKRFSLEAYKDHRNGHLLYVSNVGDLSLVPWRYAIDTARRDAPKGRTHLYGMDLKVRKHGETAFAKDTRGYAIEVYRDENNNNLVYVTQTGTLAVVPAALLGPGGVGKTVGVASLQGFDLAVRKASEQKITPKTRRFGVEVYRDNRTNNLIYLSESGDLSVVPARLVRAPAAKLLQPTLQHAYDLTVRRAGENAVTPATRRVGVEAYRDETTGNLMYISQTGALAVVSPHDP